MIDSQQRGECGSNAQMFSFAKACQDHNTCSLFDSHQNSELNRTSWDLFQATNLLEVTLAMFCSQKIQTLVGGAHLQ